MNRTTALAGAAAVLSLFFASATGAQKASPARGVCQSVWVTAPGYGKPAPRTRKPLNFSASDVVDLEFQVVVSAAAPAALDLKVFTPKGHLYQELSLSSTNAGPVSSNPTRRPRYRTLTATFPVAGTTIVNSSLYGTWRVEAFFAGERAACAKPRAFVIKP
jgi:hypothetical protein